MTFLETPIIQRFSLVLTQWLRWLPPVRLVTNDTEHYGGMYFIRKSDPRADTCWINSTIAFSLIP
jgi:hypothetical protein